jgi:hypothetical protein
VAEVEHLERAASRATDVRAWALSDNTQGGAASSLCFPLYIIQDNNCGPGYALQRREQAQAQLSMDVGARQNG